jgi:hypothetical protein
MLLALKGVTAEKNPAVGLRQKCMLVNLNWGPVGGQTHCRWQHVCHKQPLRGI